MAQTATTQAGAFGSTVLTSQTIGASSETRRSAIEDQYRMLFPEDASFQAMISSGALAKGRDMVKQPERIAKKQVTHQKYEVFVYTPISNKMTAAADLSTLTLTVDSTAGFTAPMLVGNTANGKVARVDSVTDSTTIVFTKVDTDFDVSTGDVLVSMAPAYAENSTDPYIRQKNYDSADYYLQIMRYAIAISNSRKQNEHWVGNIWTNYKKQMAREFARLVDYNLIHSSAGASSGKTTAAGTLTDTFSTADGLMNIASKTSDAGGSLTYDWFVSTLPEDISDTISSKKTLTMLCGKKVKGTLLGFGRDALIVNDSGKKEEFGFYTDVYRTDGPNIRVVEHDSFNKGDNKAKAILFDNDDVFYAYMKNRDFKPSENIQDPARDGQIDEIIGEVGVGSFSGGEQITKLINLVPLA